MEIEIIGPSVPLELFHVNVTLHPITLMALNNINYEIYSTWWSSIPTKNSTLKL